ncbi:T9SS type A sorting domain-containing protein [Microvirga sp. STS02]|uniref:T9SS type A sorting domain-containing protein n=1 Tax=Hymenobacter negativus TaxID=2795026 RepID=UPI0018DB8C84|nr:MULTISPECIES: T9SS type A sorting domain-containing protein [Bacteria]MBH8569891.1 T9SS type A sorting domain-containing protein [Hymenobacter negativus]MBR7209630.1 T9SS type A sorting domain-containing protein [Microvirga sp. STS02]
MKNLLLPALLLAGGLGLTQQAAAQTTPVFKFWSLKANAQDSAALRSPSTMAASSVTLRKFVLSNGTAAAPPKPFSSLYGMAFAPSADGGGWSTGSGGTGSTLRRYYSVQVTATAPAGTTLRADSVVMNLTFLSTTSGTNVGVVYSKNGFTSPADSTEATGSARTPSGTTVGAANGTTLFNTFQVTPSIALPTAGAAPAPNNLRYAIPLNGATGVTIAPGQTLTVRIYVSCSSSSVGRYALLRNLALKSQQAALATRAGLATTSLAAYPNPVQNRLNVPHTAAGRDARVTVFSTTGARVASFSAQPGTTETAVDLSSLSRGLYLVEYADGGQRSSARITKE